jgi:SAM-dependent methyltransferase
MMNLARYWDASLRQFRQSPQRLWRVHSDAVNGALVTDWLPASNVGTVLKTDLFDEALGEGLYPLMASTAQRDVGLDLSFNTVQAAKARYPALAAPQADVRRLPFAASAFDCIVSNSTLDHFESKAQIIIALREFHRVLRPGGQLLLTLDNPLNPLIALRNALPFSLWQHMGAVSYYVGATLGPISLRRTLAQLGFEVKEMRALMHCPRVIAIPLAWALEKYARPATQRRYLQFLMAFERLSPWPLGLASGHFVAAKAVKL